MKSERPLQAAYAIARPMKIGKVKATTIAVDLTNVVFESPEPFAPGGEIEFSIAIAASGIQLECRGGVTSCEQRPDGRFQAAATIDHLRVT